jgi:hypothetical protein
VTQIPYVDPLQFLDWGWGHVPRKLYRKQKEIVESVLYDRRTVVPAGNLLGKDYVAGFIVPYFFLTRQPCRIVTTSAKDQHLIVLWGEINSWIQSCKYPLRYEYGGPLVVTHQNIRKVIPQTGVCPISYVLGMVSSPDRIAAMQGHHVAKTGDGVPRTLFVADEASSVPDEYFKMAGTWADRMLIIGNCWPTSNYFFRAVEEGDVLATDDIPPPEKFPAVNTQRSRWVP